MWNSVGEELNSDGGSGIATVADGIAIVKNVTATEDVE
jgi:hypothetical protein